MTPEMLQKLLKLTAIELPEDQKPAVLDYFNSMKAMFDDFASFPLPEWEINVEGDESINCFTEKNNKYILKIKISQIIINAQWENLSLRLTH